MQTKLQQTKLHLPNNNLQTATEIKQRTRTKRQTNKHKRHISSIAQRTIYKNTQQQHEQIKKQHSPNNERQPTTNDQQTTKNKEQITKNNEQRTNNTQQIPMRRTKKNEHEQITHTKQELTNHEGKRTTTI